MALNREIEKRKENLKILDLEPGARKDQIRKAYTSLALKYHPDKNPEDPNATEKFQKLSKAYDELTKPLDLHTNYCPIHGFFCNHESEDEFSDDEEWSDYEDEMLYQYKQMFMRLFSSIIFGRKFKAKKKRRPPTKEETEQEEFFEYLNKKYKEEESEDEFVLTEEDLKKFHSYEAWETEQKANGKKRRRSRKRKKSERVPQTEQPTLSKKQLHTEQRRREQEMKKIGEELSKKIKTEKIKDRAPSPAPKRKGSKEVEKTIMETIQKQQEENRKREEALQEKLKELDGQEKSQNKKQQRKDKKAQRKQQKLETLKPTQPENKMELEEDIPVKNHKSSGLELPLKEDIKRPKVTRNHTAKSSVLQRYFNEPAKAAAPERPQPVSVVSDPGPTSNKPKGDPALLEKHLKMYNDLMKIQPQRHTEQQLKLEREAERRQLLQKNEDELNKLRGQYKTVAMTSSFNNTNNNSVDSSQDTGGNKGREYYLQKHKEMEKRRNAEEDEINRAIKKSVPEIKKKPAPKWYQMDLSKPEPICQEPFQHYDPALPVSSNIWQKRAVEQERKNTVLSELLPETEEEETRMIREALRASMETAAKEKPRYDQKPPHRSASSVTHNWDRTSCNPCDSVWDITPESQTQVSNTKDLHSAVLERQQYWENQQRLSNATGNQPTQFAAPPPTSDKDPKQNELHKKQNLDSLCSFDNEEDWQEVPRDKSFSCIKIEISKNNTFGIQQNVENPFNVLENQPKRLKNKHGQQSNEQKDTLQNTKTTSAKNTNKGLKGKESKVISDNRNRQVDNNVSAAKSNTVTSVNYGGIQWLSSSESDDWDEPMFIQQAEIVEKIGDSKMPNGANTGDTENWDIPLSSQKNGSKKDHTKEKDKSTKQSDRKPKKNVTNKFTNETTGSNGKLGFDSIRQSVLKAVAAEKLPAKQSNSKFENFEEQTLSFLFDPNITEVKDALSIRKNVTQFETIDNIKKSMDTKVTVEEHASSQTCEDASSSPATLCTSSEPSDGTKYADKSSSPATFGTSSEPSDEAKYEDKSSTPANFGKSSKPSDEAKNEDTSSSPATFGTSSKPSDEAEYEDASSSHATFSASSEPSDKAIYEDASPNPATLGLPSKPFDLSAPTDDFPVSASFSTPASLVKSSKLSDSVSQESVSPPTATLITPSQPSDLGACENTSTSSASFGSSSQHSNIPAAGVGQTGQGGGLPYGLPLHLRQAYLQYLQQSSLPTPGNTSSKVPAPTLPMYDPVLNPFGLTSVAMMILQQQMGSFYQNFATQQLLAAGLIPNHLRQQQQAGQQLSAQVHNQSESSKPSDKQVIIHQDNNSMQNVLESEKAPNAQSGQGHDLDFSRTETEDDDYMRLPKVPSLSSRLLINNPSVMIANHSKQETNYQGTDQGLPSMLLSTCKVEDDIDKDAFDEPVQLQCTTEESIPPPRPPYSADLRGRVYIPPHRRAPDGVKPDTKRNMDTHNRLETPVQNVDRDRISTTSKQIKKTWDDQNGQSHDSTSERSSRKSWRRSETIDGNTSTIDNFNQTSNVAPRGRFRTPNVQKIPSDQDSTSSENNTACCNQTTDFVDYRTVPAHRGGFGIPGRRNKGVAKQTVTDEKPPIMTEIFSVSSHGDYRNRGGFGTPSKNVNGLSTGTTEKGDSSWKQNGDNAHIQVSHRGGFGTPQRTINTSTPSMSHDAQTHLFNTNNIANNTKTSNTWSMLHTNYGSTSVGLNGRFSSLPKSSMENVNTASISHAQTLKGRKERSHAVLEMLKGMKVNDNEDVSHDNMMMEQRDF